jgi:membrane associated rhomboid family serine protease
VSFTKDFKNTLSGKNNELLQLIVINVIVFILANVGIAFINWSGSSPLELLQWLAIPADIQVFGKHFWTLITYMFVHTDLWHIFFNMLWLYWIGSIFMEYLGGKRLLATYITGGLFGGLFFITSSFIPGFYNNTYLLGASAGVMAVVISTAVLLPEYSVHLMFIGMVKLKYLALASFVLTTIIDLSQNTGGKIAHMGGALWGYIYMVQYKKGNDMSRWITVLFSKKNRMKVVHKKKVSDEDYNLSKAALQRRVDEILDKISRSGYASLSKEEKDILFKISNKKK